MTNKVYFVPVSQKDSKAEVIVKLERLLQESGVLDFVKKDETTAIKLHFGEDGNTGFVAPEYLCVIADKVTSLGGTPFLTDTNTLYKGRRTNARDHLELAKEHGFIYKNVHAPIIIADGEFGAAYKEVELNGRFIKKAAIAKAIKDADSIVGVAHFKGHIIAGFGGALKNIGMGCASRKGKLAQHSSVSPYVHKEGCNGCNTCVEECPVDAITLIEKKADIDGDKCIGCATCIAVCPVKTIDVHWEAGADDIQEKMTEYAKAALSGKEKKQAYLNFAIKITKECDCLAKDDPRVCDDIGIFASTNPVAIDKACADKVLSVAKKDIFTELHPKRDWHKQLAYAAEIGLGNLDYELVPLA